MTIRCGQPVTVQTALLQAHHSMELGGAVRHGRSGSMRGTSTAPGRRVSERLQRSREVKPAVPGHQEAPSGGELPTSQRADNGFRQAVQGAEKARIGVRASCLRDFLHCKWQ
jgi:hypothetical protein